MIRLLIFLLWVIVFAAALTLLFGVRSAVETEALGWRFEIPLGVAAALALALAALIALATSVLKDFVGAPKSARARREMLRRERGVAAVTKGLEAIAMGDAAGARRHANAARKALGGAPVAKLIAAQAAHLSGDDAAASEALAGMLEAPETEFLALKGLYAKAMRDGDIEAARGYAERAFDLRDKARWAFDAVFDLALARHDFTGANHALERAAKSGAVDRASADRGAAATLAAAAFAAEAAGDHETALSDAEAALKRAPGLAPAAVLAARILCSRGDARKAEKLLGRAFAAAPERAVAESLVALFTAEPTDARAAALERLASKNLDSREAGLLRARASILREDAAGAVAMIAETLKAAAPARALSLMAEAQMALKGAAAARFWLERAANAPREASPGAEAFFRIAGDGWRRLIHEYMSNGRLAPPLLDESPPGLPEDDLALIAPPVAADGARPPPVAHPTPAVDAIGDLSLDFERPAPDDPSTDELLEKEAAAARGVN